jgi:Zn-dependent peptidase ImmA (M78 family)
MTGLDTESQLRLRIMDAEASEFAMELLMPTHLLRADIARYRPDLTDDDAISRLAKKYRVPFATMAIRIGQVILERD